MDFVNVSDIEQLAREVSRVVNRYDNLPIAILVGALEVVKQEVILQVVAGNDESS